MCKLYNMHVLFSLLLLQTISQIGCWDIVIEQVFSKNISIIYMILIRKNQQFDQNLQQITFFLLFPLKK